VEKKVAILGLLAAAALFAQGPAPSHQKVILSDVVFIHEGAEEPYGQELILKISQGRVDAVWQALQPYPEPVNLSGTLEGKRLVLSGSSGKNSHLRIEGILERRSFHGTIVTDYGTRQVRERIKLRRVAHCWFADRCGD
jgi:multidrug efflux pump subunit AcrA (membrane-fusion protein)